MNQAPLAPSGSFCRLLDDVGQRLGWNFGLQRAVDYAVAFGRPLVIRRRCGVTTRAQATGSISSSGTAAWRSIDYGPRGASASTILTCTVARRWTRGVGDAARLTRAVNTDWYPASFLLHMIGRAAYRLTVRLEAVDLNGSSHSRCTAVVHRGTLLPSVRRGSCATTSRRCPKSPTGSEKGPRTDVGSAMVAKARPAATERPLTAT
jgi:hypothetical protein